MRPHPHLRFRIGEGWIEARHRARCIAAAEVLRSGQWLVRRCVSLGDGSNSIHPDREDARTHLVSWCRAYVWKIDRHPHGRTASKALRRAPM